MITKFISFSHPPLPLSLSLSLSLKTKLCFIKKKKKGVTPTNVIRTRSNFHCLFLIHMDSRNDRL